MNTVEIENKVKESLTKFNQRMIEIRKDYDFNKLTKKYIFENFLTINLRLPARNNTPEWAIGNLVKNENDIIIVEDVTTYLNMKEFKSAFYTDLNQAVFDRISKNVFLPKNLPSQPYDKRNYKVIVLDFTNIRFKTDLYGNLAKSFPEASCVLGFN